ncbi:MAG: hypothetical protein FWG57_04985 [Endomicrobia bacterium]|nr:hypothetical protein [Endomicrobiia bacterium]
MKNLLLILSLFIFVISLIACGKSHDNKNTNPIIHNTVNGKQLYFTPMSNYANVRSNEQGLILVSGQTYSFKAYVEKYVQENDWWEMDNAYDCSNTVWTISGIGYFGSEGITATAGETVSIAINTPANTSGTLRLDLDGMIFSFSVKVVSKV